MSTCRKRLTAFPGLKRHSQLFKVRETLDANMEESPPVGFTIRSVYKSLGRLRVCNKESDLADLKFLNEIFQDH